MSHTAEETRGLYRCPTLLKGLYSLDDKKGEGKECTIINISVNGAGMEFYTDESVEVNSKLFLEILPPPDEEETIPVEGIIRWVKQGKKDCVCGIQLTEKLNEAQKAMLKV
jgi:hypothetical protein